MRLPLPKLSALADELDLSSTLAQQEEAEVTPSTGAATSSSSAPPGHRRLGDDLFLFDWKAKNLPVLQLPSQSQAAGRKKQARSVKRQHVFSHSSEDDALQRQAGRTGKKSSQPQQ